MEMRRTLRILLATIFLLAVFTVGEAVERNSTFCNPINIDYRFALDEPSRREAADPVIVLYKDNYYLFASKSGGYWFSNDMREWTFIEPEGLPNENYAPAILILGERMYYTASKSKTLYATDDPESGKWSKVADLDSYSDPAFFLDDGRVFLCHGAALNGSISVVELNPKDNFRVVAGPFKLMGANFAEHGWERSGEENLGALRNSVFRADPYIEGSWMTKHNGIYYLQYSAPGTIWKSYADGVYTSRTPTGGFTYAPYSPFSYKPGGFIGSAGHAATFQDKKGNYWRVVTMVVSVAHKFERRLGIFPAGFDRDGMMRTNTYLGDYPQFLPDLIANPLDKNLTNWMLLSYGKKAAASSTLNAHPLKYAFDEDVRTFWSAETGNKGEWLSVDLGKPCAINALQVNFAEQDAKALGRQERLYQQFVVEVSNDNERWSVLIDQSHNLKDVPHYYVQLDGAKRARYVKVTNIHTPASGKFAIRDLRLFGNGMGRQPARVEEFTARRALDDGRSITLHWRPASLAIQYIIRYGIAPDKLYNSYQVQDGAAKLTINSLNKGVTYYFTIDALNESGVARGKLIKKV